MSDKQGGTGAASRKLAEREMCPDGEMGDVYVSEIKRNARKIA